MQPPLLGDVVAQKGVLYVKLDLSSIGGSDLHLFSTHTQASYLGDVRLYAETFLIRYRQIQEIKYFMESKFEEMNKEGNLMILLGDFNQNSSKADKSSE